MIHLLVKRGDQVVQDVRLSRGPVYMGRHSQCQVILPDKPVSRLHAVLYHTRTDGWVIEDLHSTNKTFLNDKEIHKSPVKSGDCVRITNFTIELDLGDAPSAQTPASFEDTYGSSTGHFSVE